VSLFVYVGLELSMKNQLLMKIIWWSIWTDLMTNIDTDRWMIYFQVIERSFISKSINCFIRCDLL